MSDAPRSATVRAVSATRVLAVDREAFQAMFTTLPPLRGVFGTSSPRARRDGDPVDGTAPGVICTAPSG